MKSDNSEMPGQLMSGKIGQRQRYALLSHDLRSALSDVVGGLKLIERRALNKEAAVQIDRVAAASEALSRLLDSILADADDQAALVTPPATNFKLSDFLDDTERRWAGQAREKGLELIVDREALLPAVVTLDRVSLDRIVGNFVSNAIKYAGKGTVALSVYCKDNKDLCFQVTDEGEGFSDSAFGQLFEFEGRPTDSAAPGSGLGLFIAKELSDQLTGKIRIKNRDGGGACVRLVLPHPAWFDRSLRREELATPGPADLSHLKILLAEDNATNQLVATQMLSSMGAEHVVASDGLEALEHLKKDVFDLALLDIEMPRMSGLELIKEVRRSKGSTSKMPLVALTAYVMREHRDRIYEAGADGIIAKPLMSVEALGTAILEHLNKRQLATESDTIKSSGSVDSLDRARQIVDRKVFDNLVQTIGPASTEELLGKLQADTDSVAEGIALGKHHLNLVELRAQTHILISVAGAIGAVRLQNIAERLNDAANHNAADEIDQLCDECLAGLAELQGFISDEQNKAALSA